MTFYDSEAIRDNCDINRSRNFPRKWSDSRATAIALVFNFSLSKSLSSPLPQEVDYILKPLHNREKNIDFIYIFVDTNSVITLKTKNY